MATVFTKGDIFHTDGVRAYAFGSNCRGAMESGIAVAVKKRWPKMADALAARASSGELHLGDVLAYREGDETLYALMLQENESSKAKLATLTKAATKLAEMARASGIERVGLARPGTGKAGLDGPRVKSVLTEVGDAADVVLVVFEQFVRGAADKTAPR